ncbi:ATP phosphoribosyltransferase [Rothia amarae]|uniref:ATP phosphoribosyltransferase n=1 Tax=Rothia amarae TaxID=169480 RepID=A0A7H2BHH8_9MICC|nr:ATP phosphoribosyltransferase [Rothia amarae]QNV39124.1 ATP phosphoribosyltransferase [Rothia amarae]
MLRVAVPNKGALSEAATQMLKESGYLQRRDSRELVIADAENDVEFFYLRPRDIAVYVGKGTLDVGITGRDLLQDSEAPAQEVMGLDFARSTFHFAGPKGKFTSIEQLNGKRIATSYSKLVRRYLQENNIDAAVTRLDGAIESSIRLGVADAIADVVETGNTMRAAGLEPFGEALMKSEALLIKRAGVEDRSGLDKLARRLRGVLIARQYVLMDYDIDQALLPRATAITPGLEAPTISPLERDGWVAVRSMVPRTAVNKIMDELYEIGARAILVSPIQAARL